jgi:hypothetical protein
MFLPMVGFLYKQQKKRGAGVQAGTGGHFGGEIGRTNTKECLNEGIT